MGVLSGYFGESSSSSLSRHFVVVVLVLVLSLGTSKAQFRQPSSGYSTDNGDEKACPVGEAKKGFDLNKVRYTVSV